MEVVTNERATTSCYVDAGAPTHCFLPGCRKRFDARCVHGRDGHYYCSEACCEEARPLDLSHVKELPRNRPKNLDCPVDREVAYEARRSEGGRRL